MNISKLFAVLVATTGLVLSGCATRLQQQYSVQTVVAASAPVTPGKCVMSGKMGVAAQGFRIVSFVTFVNDTSQVFVLDVTARGLPTTSIAVCPNGGMADVALPHAMTDSVYRDYVLVFRSVGPNRADERARVGTYTTSVGGYQAQRQVVRASYASQVY